MPDKIQEQLNRLKPVYSDWIPADKYKIRKVVDENKKSLIERSLQIVYQQGRVDSLKETNL